MRRFKFRLALALGRTVGELESSMPVGEFIEWQRYYSLEPFGATRDNIHTGILASILVNIHRKKGAPASKYDDFMLMDKYSQEMKKRTNLMALLDSMANKNGN